MLSATYYPANHTAKKMFKKMLVVFMAPLIPVVLASIFLSEYMENLNEAWFGVTIVSYFFLGFLTVFLKIKKYGKALPNNCYDPPKT